MPYAARAMNLSSAGQGLGAMTLPNPGMSNQMDGGSPSKPYANAQQQRNQELSMQNARQNEISRQPQVLAGAQGMARKEMVAESDQNSKNQMYFNQNVANQLERMGIGQSVAKLSDQATFDRVSNDVAVSQAMNQTGQAPELGRMTAEANRYV